MTERKLYILEWKKNFFEDTDSNLSNLNDEQAITILLLKGWWNKSLKICSLSYRWTLYSGIIFEIFCSLIKYVNSFVEVFPLAFFGEILRSFCRIFILTCFYGDILNCGDFRKFSLKNWTHENKYGENE